MFGKCVKLHLFGYYYITQTKTNRIGKKINNSHNEIYHTYIKFSQKNRQFVT